MAQCIGKIGTLLCAVFINNNIIIIEKNRSVCHVHFALYLKYCNIIHNII